ncbi:hypothetical protein BFP70_05170 [Thioclava sp. SK-1]|uniref:hypothetical protein n=1 Tax=Thioclava sp. SK-1 TaxID=1889770 RepID=UPI00082420C3|nr:hypothetical protein [Thioclava sp. SK-1]OCX66415.1 hypothetical protein BFP70_05170 [Thioclava sp. SK-1]
MIDQGVADEVLLLTGAINTSPKMANNQRSNSDLRRADYHEGLGHYIDTVPARIKTILFCENTNADLSDFEPFKARAAARGITLELLSFQGETSPELGKGICEFEILDTAYRFLAQRFARETFVWKITGRLLVKNIAAMIASRPQDADIYVDMRSVPLIGERLGGNDWAEMRMLGYRLGTYEDLLLGQGRRCGYVTEKGLFTLLQEARDTGAKIAPRYRVQPRFKGICGGSNKDYESFEYRMKDNIRGVARVVAPGLWL